MCLQMCMHVAHSQFIYKTGTSITDSLCGSCSETYKITRSQVKGVAPSGRNITVSVFKQSQSLLLCGIQHRKHQTFCGEMGIETNTIGIQPIHTRSHTHWPFNGQITCQVSLYLTIRVTTFIGTVLRTTSLVRKI